MGIASYARLRSTAVLMCNIHLIRVLGLSHELKPALWLTEAMLNAEGRRFSFIDLEKWLTRRHLYG